MQNDLDATERKIIRRIISLDSAVYIAIPPHMLKTVEKYDR